MQAKVDLLLSQVKPSALKKAFEELSFSYRREGCSPPLFQSEEMLLAYLASRLPATFAAAYHVLRRLPLPLQSWVDVGAGPGSASWAAATLFPEARKAIFLEKSREAIALGKRLAADHPLLGQALWIAADRPEKVEGVDAAIFSYSLGEMSAPLDWIDWWWKSAASFLVIIEPGTPARFALLRKMREELLSWGAHILAPCAHQLACPMQGGDWCHFSVQIQRSRLQRYLKGGDLGYEDEKYCYLIASKKGGFFPAGVPILRHPKKQSGRVGLTLCTREGKVEEKWVSRKDKILYRQARDAEWGDFSP